MWSCVCVCMCVCVCVCVCVCACVCVYALEILHAVVLDVCCLCVADAAVEQDSRDLVSSRIYQDNDRPTTLASCRSPMPLFHI